MCCGKTLGIIFFIIGIIYLVADLVAGWNFWGINWWTVMFILVGLGACLGKKKK
ncbi:hypothetical protein H8D36_02915 [archaeon]|nr:hypothetical protein [archaeon]MBL7057485.1 hypothetical protein [Candidatus Woesearchaeota archaeon]